MTVQHDIFTDELNVTRLRKDRTLALGVRTAEQGFDYQAGDEVFLHANTENSVQIQRTKVAQVRYAASTEWVRGGWVVLLLAAKPEDAAGETK